MPGESRHQRLENYIVHYSPLVSRLIIRFDSAFDLGAFEVLRNRRSFKVARTVKYRAFWADAGWEPSIYGVLDRYLDADHSFIDLGAWIGPATLYAAASCRRVFAVEPDPVAFHYLRRNILLNPGLAPRITALECCVGGRDGTARLFSKSAGGDAEAALSLRNPKTAWTVKCLTLDTLAAENGIDDCGLIKMDIEGAEFAVLPAMAGFIERFRPTLHLSVHAPPAGDAAPAASRLAGALSTYRGLYLEDGRRTSPSELVSDDFLGKYYTLIATDR